MNASVILPMDSSEESVVQLANLMPAPVDQIAYLGTTLVDTSAIVTNFMLDYTARNHYCKLARVTGGEDQFVAPVHVTLTKVTMPTVTKLLENALVK